MTHDEPQNNSSNTGTKVPMTHDELLAKVDEGKNSQNLQFSDWYALTYNGKNSVNANANALRAVVELTRKYEDFDGVDSAGMSGYRLAMKAVIQAIEKELK